MINVVIPICFIMLAQSYQKYDTELLKILLTLTGGHKFKIEFKSDHWPHLLADLAENQ